MASYSFKKIDVVIEFGKISKAGGIEKNNTNFKEVDYFSKNDVDVFIDLFKNVVEEEKMENKFLRQMQMKILN